MQLLGRLKAFHDIINEDRESNPARDRSGRKGARGSGLDPGPGLCEVQPASHSIGRAVDVPVVRKPFQSSLFESKEGLPTSAVALTVDTSSMCVVGASACNLADELARCYLDGRLGVFFPTVLAELCAAGYAVAAATPIQGTIVHYTLTKAKGASLERTPRRPPAALHREPPPPPAALPLSPRTARVERNPASLFNGRARASGGA